MNYFELSIPRPANPDKEDLFIARLAALGFESFSEDDSYIRAYISEAEYLRKHPQRDEWFVRFRETCHSQLKLIEEQNWNQVWESNYTPVVIGSRCLIRAPFHDAQPEMDFDIVLQPKMAFGTAHHETTALMIGFLLDLRMDDKNVLDMGSGTGVLGILAAKKGANKVTAIDNDKYAYESTIENAALNGVSGMEVAFGGAELLGKDDYDICLANINKNVLMRDMHIYFYALNSNGLLIVSGFYAADLDDIKSRANQMGLIFVDHNLMNDWVIAIFRKQ